MPSRSESLTLSSIIRSCQWIGRNTSITRLSNSAVGPEATDTEAKVEPNDVSKYELIATRAVMLPNRIMRVLVLIMKLPCGCVKFCSQSTLKFPE